MVRKPLGLALAWREGKLKGWANPALKRSCLRDDTPVIIVRSLKMGIVAVELLGDCICEEGFVRRAVDRNVIRKIIGSWYWCAERGGKSITVELEVDDGVEFSCRVWPAEESQAACRDMSGKVTAHQNGGADDLRGEECQYCAGAPHYARGAALAVVHVPDGTMVTASALALALAALLRARDGALLEGLVVVRPSGELEMELQATSLLKVARPDFSGLVRADARYQKNEREVVWLLAYAERWEVVDSVVKKVGL